MVYAWAFKPNFNQTISVEYLGLNQDTVYEIPFDTFLPSITVCNNFYALVDHRDAECNDPKYWEVYFI